MDEERQERIRYYSFAAFVGALLLLNVTGIWKTIFGVDTAVIITLLAGYKTFHNSISSLLEKRISADIALKNARRYGHGAMEELKVLVLHGMLHLAGYDHERDNGRMAAQEARLRAQLKLPASLIDRAHSGGGKAVNLQLSMKTQDSKSAKRKPTRKASGAEKRRRQP